jgi:hypothetical protein
VINRLPIAVELIQADYTIEVRASGRQHFTRAVKQPCGLDAMTRLPKQRQVRIDEVRGEAAASIGSHDTAGENPVAGAHAASLAHLAPAQLDGKQ